MSPLSKLFQTKFKIRKNYTISMSWRKLTWVLTIDENSPIYCIHKMYTHKTGTW